MWARFSAPVQTGPGAHPASCTMGTGSFPGVKCGRGVTLTPRTFLEPWSRKRRAIPVIPLWAVRAVQSLSACRRVQFTFPKPLLPLWAVRPVQNLSACTTVHFNFTYTSTTPMGRTACTEPQYLYNGALYLYLYLYSPCGPYGLYRTSVPVQRRTLTLPTPLLPYGPYGLFRTSVPVQGCTLPLPIPLLPLWAVRPLQSLSICITVLFNFTYTSTPPMGRTACTEPQCPYNGAL